MFDWKYLVLEIKGSFIVNIGLRKGKFFVQPVFILQMEKEYLKVLEAFRNEFEIGRVVKSEKYVTYMCRGINECLIFASKIDENKFITSKKQDFALWKLILKKIKNLEHLNKEGFLSICELRDKMNLDKKKKNYKSRKYFEKLIEKKKIVFENFEKRKKIAETLRKTYSLRI